MPGKDAEYYSELQTQTGWGRTLTSFAEWCAAEPGWLTLDVGCGPGLLPAVLAKNGCRAVGVDVDIKMFRPHPLHPGVTAANVFSLPFKPHTFDMVTASNLLFLLPEPAVGLTEMCRVSKIDGKIALLNPSENLDVPAAIAFAEQRELEGLARETLIHWAKRAELNYHWTEAETRELFRQAGLNYGGSEVKVGPGFARFSWGTAHRV